MTVNRIKAITVYQAADGQNYEDIEEARKMSAQYVARQKLAKILENMAYGSGITTNTLIAAILTKPEFASSLRDGINSALDYQRRYGKLKKVDTEE